MTIFGSITVQQHLRHDVRLRAAVREIYDACYPGENGMALFRSSRRSGARRSIIARLARQRCGSGRCWLIGPSNWR